MATKKKTQAKSNAGRPTDYKPEYALQAYRMCLLGYIDTELAEFFGVTEKTLNNWKHAHPEFLQSLKNGRGHADAAVANSLFEKSMSGDTTACIFWLKNRRTKTWRDKHDIEQSGSVDVNHSVDLSKLAGDEIKALQALLLKAQPVKIEPPEDKQ